MANGLNVNTEPGCDITFVISDLTGGGAQRVLTNLANAWVQRGRRVYVITFADKARDFFPLDAAVRRICIGGMKVSGNPITALLANWKRIAALRQAIKDSQAPIVISFVGTTNILAILAAWGLKKRVVISERNDPAMQSLGRLWDGLRWMIYRYADVVTANSRGVLKTLATFVPPPKLAYVPNVMAIPPDDGSKALEAPTILTIGRLHPQKAYDVLLDAFALVVSQAPDWRLSCIGEGSLQTSLRDQAQRLKIAEKVYWHGRIDNPFPYYRSAEIFVLPSRYEGTPNALLEAMSCGLPVIVSDASAGPLEYVENEISGLVVQVNHSEVLANALLRLISDPALRKRLGKAARVRTAECEIANALPVWEKVIGV